MRGVYIFACCMSLLVFSLRAEAYCVYNTSDSDLSVEVHGGGVVSYYFKKFEETIAPGSSKCCPGGNSECEGKLAIYCLRYGQKVGSVMTEVGNRGWIKVKCTRDSSNEPYRLEVIERQFKVD